jgi:membrane-associated phospholipid phosphatase
VVVGAGGTAFAVSKLLKIILQTPRPFITLDFVPLVVETGYSMPSSHATVFSALATVAFGINRDLGIGFSLFALLIGVSRIVLGVHYPSDIIIGFALGIIIGLAFLAFGKSNFARQFFDKHLSKLEAKLVK